MPEENEGPCSECGSTHPECEVLGYCKCGARVCLTCFWAEHVCTEIEPVDWSEDEHAVSQLD